MAIAVFVGAGVLVLLLVAWAGHRTLTARGSHSSGTADALGNFIDVFDPARARADRDLQSREHMGEVIPSPDNDDPPIRIDTEAMRATIRRPDGPSSRRR
jgi:hypothetical protein